MIDESVVKNILSELSRSDYACFSSEAQLRDAFAITLVREYPHCVVYPEYTQPKPNGWRCSEDLIHFDLLVEDKDSNETILFEFKYKTKKSEFDLGRFTIYLRDHSDTTNGRYAVWRDIYRVETFVNLKKITKGFIIFITNHSTYYAEPKSGVSSEQFSLAPGLHLAGNRNWNIPSNKTLATYTSVQASYRDDIYPLIINNDYYFSYSVYSKIKDLNQEDHTFMQLVLPIHSDDYNKEIETALRKTGKKNFAKYYRIFKDNPSDACKDILKKEGFKEDSIDTIVSGAKQLIKQHRDIEALRNIVASSKVDEEARKIAIDLLK